MRIGHDVVVLLGKAGFWQRNSTEVQALATVALVILTGLYVAFTRKYVALTEKLTSKQDDAISAAREANDVARQSIAQQVESLIAARTANEVAREAIKQEQRFNEQEILHSRALYDETLKQRQDSQTPVCSVEFQWLGLHRRDGGGQMGTVTRDEFWKTDYDCPVSATITNHGPGPAQFWFDQVSTGQCRQARGTEPQADHLVIPENERLAFIWSLRGRGIDFATGWSGTVCELVIITTSLIVRVYDRHYWKFELSVPQNVDPLTMDHITVEYDSVATVDRHYPQDS